MATTRYLSSQRRLDAFIQHGALRRGWVDPDRMRQALAEQASGDTPRPLGTILVANGWLTPARFQELLEDFGSQAIEAARVRMEELPLGRILVEKGIVTAEQVQECVKLQAEAAAGSAGYARLGDLLVEKGYATAEAIAHALAYQGKTILACEQCGRRVNMSGFDPARVYTCSPCQGELSPLPVFENVRVTDTALDLSLTGGMRADVSGQVSPPVLGKYVILRKISRGGMAIVYEALDTSLDRKVALKLMRERTQASPEEQADDDARFVRESRLAARLPKHPNVVGVYEAGIVEGKRYIAMELIEGIPLSEWRAKYTPPLAQQVEVLRDVALAVEHIHRHGLIHRDIKPTNILIDGEGRPHITDFGVAKRPGAKGDSTAVDVVLGTPGYMSPEQGAGGITLDGRSDLYSLGILLYEILTDRLPFMGNTLDVLVQAMSQPVTPPTKVVREAGRPLIGKGLEPVCLRALAKNREDRPPDAASFARELTAWLESDEGQRARHPRPEAPPPDRRALLLVLGLVLVLAGAGLAAALLARLL